MMLASIGLITKEVVEVLLVGLGGGGLATFIGKHFPKVSLDVVEIDPAMAKVAMEQFEFAESDKVRLILDDGIDFIEKKSKSKAYDVVLFDVDSKDTTIGMSCPPPAFLAPDTLSAVRLILKDSGVFVINLVCRDEDLRKSTLKDVLHVFQVGISRRIPDEVNEVVFCACEGGALGPLSRRVDAAHPLAIAVRAVNDVVEDLVDVAAALKELKLVS